LPLTIYVNKGVGQHCRSLSGEMISIEKQQHTTGPAAAKPAIAQRIDQRDY
jgi:hypothetical protein